ncbi:MAG: hypothetical protein JOY98_10770 [Candidatus Eremiobacteraeota bacterium]|nr:hypothetical protein [Candidatus Eremiobacteraeota bacterium]MBV8723163.1 hypothetical protein [Candidatus Eremiobacteraeota bacterium]
MNVRLGIVLFAVLSLLAGCAGSSGVTPPPVTPFAALQATISVKPTKLNVPQGASATVTVSEVNYTGTFTAKSRGKDACKGIATYAPAQGKGPKLKVKFTGTQPGSCTIAFSDASKHVAKLPVTVLAVPLDYVYVVNFNSNDVAQYAFNSDATMKALAPNYKLPSTCVNPDAIALAPAGDLAFISCYASGSVLALKINPADHTLGASTISPAPVPSPLDAIAPASGAPNALYVDGGGASTGTLAAFTYTPNSLTALGTYSVPGPYPDELAFNTDTQGNSTLYVASPFDPVTGCPNSYSSGAIERWSQDAAGHLAAETSFPVCASFYNVANVGGTLFWAGPSSWGGFSLSTNAPVPMPSVPWSAGQGPGYNPDALNAVLSQTKPSARAEALHGEIFSVAAQDGEIYIQTRLSNGFWSHVTVPQSGGLPGDGGNCTHVDPPLHRFGKKNESITWICWSFSGDYLLITGEDETGSRIYGLGKIPIGSAPAGQALFPVRQP